MFKLIGLFDNKMFRLVALFIISIFVLWLACVHPKNILQTEVSKCTTSLIELELVKNNLTVEIKALQEENKVISFQNYWEQTQDIYEESKQDEKNYDSNDTYFELDIF